MIASHLCMWRSLLSWPPRRCTASTKRPWSSSVHRSRGASDRLYCLTPHLRLPPFFIIPSNPMAKARKASEAPLSRPSVNIRTNRGPESLPRTRSSHTSPPAALQKAKQPPSSETRHFKGDHLRLPSVVEVRLPYL